MVTTAQEGPCSIDSLKSNIAVLEPDKQVTVLGIEGSANKIGVGVLRYNPATPRYVPPPVLSIFPVPPLLCILLLLKLTPAILPASSRILQRWRIVRNPVKPSQNLHQSPRLWLPPPRDGLAPPEPHRRPDKDCPEGGVRR